MKLKKITALAMTTCMLAGLFTGCGSSASGAQAAAQTKDEKNYSGVSGNTPYVDGKADTSEFVTVKMLVLGDPPAGGTDKKMLEKLNEIFKEKLNANLEISWIEWNNYDTKYQMELVSGTPYDLVFSSSTWLNLWDNVSKGAFMDMTDMIPYYAPQLWADTKAEEWEQCKKDDKIYALPEHRRWQLSTPGFLYRLDWANEFGIDEVNSFDTMEQYCDGILANKSGVVPFNVNATVNSSELYTLWINQDTDYVFGPGTVGADAPTANNSLEDCWEISSPIFQDDYLDFAKKMKEWGDRGYWPQDVLSATIDTQTAFLAGQSGLYHANVSNLLPMYQKMAEQDPDAKLGIFFDSEKRGYAIADSLTQDACSISANAQNPERALMMYDMFQYDPEVYKLTQYGIEGENYAVDKDGYRVKPEGYDEQLDEYHWDMWSTLNDSLSINEFNPKQAEVDAVTDKIKPWGVTSPWGAFMLDTSNIDSEITAINEAATTWMPSIQFGKAGDPKEAVEKLRDALKKAGIEDYMKEVNTQLSEYEKTNASKTESTSSTSATSATSK
ncbi:MAG: DUF3502 domain-containing protein [Lachnospiraceae bacterium]|nr:DUF3502 domain-containing protein [Lachnospiraceae bacterium]